MSVFDRDSRGAAVLVDSVYAGGFRPDAEHALDPEYARNLGVNIDELLISQPDTGEQALDITEELVRSGAVDIIVVEERVSKNKKTQESTKE